MNRNVYALLTVAALASLLNVAQAETMAERKQRIMRKYMRERQDIVQSDLGVSYTALEQEDTRIAESEQFKEPSLEFKRHEGGVAPRPIARPMPVQSQSERNWWLETEDMEEDPYADLFSSKANNEDGVNDRWSPWGNRDDSSAYESAYGQKPAERNDTYPGSRDDSFFFGDAAGQQWGGLQDDTYPGSRSAYGMPRESRYGSSVPGRTYEGYTTRRAPASRQSGQTSDFYGRQPSDTDTGWMFDSSGRYRPTPSTPSLPSATDTQGWSSQNQATGYTPYKSPYQIQDDQRRRSGGNLQPEQTPYMRPNSYQKWKDNNKSWDPTSDNSYLDELMRDQRR